MKPPLESNDRVNSSSFISHLQRHSTSGNWIPELDGLRFIAIVTVVLFHMYGQIQHNRLLVLQPRYHYLARFFSQGNRGVQLFFIISGFILARPFAQHHLFGEQWPSLRKYFLRRVTRLEPPYIFNLLVTALAVLFIQHESWRVVLPHLLASMGYVHNLIYSTPSTINPAAWSLEIEIQFYILAPLLTLLFAIEKPALRRLIAVVFILVIGACQTAGFPSFGRLALLGQLQYFLTGLLFADLFLTVMPRWNHDWKWDILSLLGWPALFLLGDSSLGLWLPFLALILYIAAFRGVVMYAIVRNTWIAVIGGMCYTLYLWHAPIMTVVQRLINRIVPALPSDYALGFFLLAVIKFAVIGAISLPLFLYLERPCMDPKWPQKLWNRLRSKTAVTEPLSPAVMEES
ncbi:MAG TPA: acyltransferase [Edaphobacter sp.]|nr:acyltransferase [Edaphobacter sp.]